MSTGFWSVARAQTTPDVPPSLQPWTEWALHGQQSRDCAKRGEQALCVWPGALKLNITKDGGTFSFEVRADVETPIVLPGSKRHWPQSVTIDGRPAVVLENQGAPSLQAPLGSHRISGRYLWSRLPKALTLPESLALVELTLDGSKVPSPRRNPKLLWLSGTPAATSDASERVDLDVYRHIQDGLPFTVHTLLQLRVSGSARELKLGTLSPEGARLVRLDSKLPVRLDAQGNLSVQVYAGTHELSAHAVFPQPPKQLSATKRPPPWPQREVWVYAPDEQLRLTELSGAPGIDPERTNLPAPWRQLSAYALTQGDSLTFKTLRRGEPEPPPNQLTLRRDLWLSLDGDRYTAQDRLSGRVTRDFRLDLEQGQLARVSIDNKPQLITQDPTSKLSGVELLRKNLNLVAEWEIATSEPLPAVAWSEEINQLGIALHLPPGWQLLTAEGVDVVSKTWFTRWDLFSVFFVLVVALSAARLVRPLCGVLALLTLAFVHGENNAPFFVWLVVLGFIALLQLLPAGAFRRWFGAGAFVAGTSLVVILLAFSVSQVRAAIYPQTDPALRHQATLGAPQAEASVVEVDEQMSVREDDRRESGSGGATRRQRSKKEIAPKGRAQYKPSISSPSSKQAWPSKDAKADLAQQQALLQAEDTVVQTGVGVPAWRWRTWQLDWSGPVKQDHQMHLRLLSPTGSRLAGLLRVLLAGWLGLILLRTLFAQLTLPGGKGGPQTSPKKSPETVATAAAVVAALCTFTTHPARAADFPDADLLKQLQSRLTAPAACHPNCLNVPALDLSLSEGDLSITAEVHAQTLSAYQLPGPHKTWQPSSVLLNGTKESALRRGEDGFLYLRVPPGSHRITLRGPLFSDELTLALGKQPMRVTASGDRWNVVGISNTAQTEGSVRLTKKQLNPRSKEKAKKDRTLGTVPWLQVTRTLHLGARWSVRTRVERVGLAKQDPPPLVTRYTLLGGEQVTQSGMQVKGGAVTLSFARGVRSLSFDSTLAVAPAIKLSAPKARPLSERWYLRCEAQWRCETTGLSPTARTKDGNYHRRFDPWPGEALTVQATKLTASPGESLTVTHTTLVVNPGVRMLRASLNMKARASRRQLLPVTLPEGSEVTELKVGGQEHPVRKDGDTIRVGVSPGQHDISLRWQQNLGMASLFVSPAVKLGRMASNIKVNVEIPGDRWLLLAGGPAWGPAILFWGYLLAIALLSFVLGRMPRSPLSTWHWLLLGIGLTQVPIAVAAFIGAWFFLFAHLDRFRPKHAIWYNFSQLGLFFVTLAFLGCLVGAVYAGLLSTPNMDVMGTDSTSSSLNWFVDRAADGALPEPWVLSTSLWGWRAVMLLWALWLASNLLKWLSFAWKRFSEDGFWKKLPPRTPFRGTPVAAGAPVAQQHSSAEVPSSSAQTRTDDGADSPD